MFGGQAELPVTFRIRMFYARGAAAHHSDRNYPIFMNTPGLKVICPSNAYDAKGLMKTAVRDNDVCMIFVPYSPALEPLIYPTPEKVLAAVKIVLD
jgi:pyruvate dehydrogenase E1 component beta subunit